MMETKLWAALFALLLIHWGSAEPDTVIVPSSDPKINLTNQSTTQPTAPPAESHAPTSHLTPTTIATTSTTHTTHPAPTDTTQTTAPPTNTSPQATPTLPVSVTASNQPTHNITHSSTSVPTPEPPKSGNTTTSTIAQSTSASSTSSSKEPPNSQTQNTAPPDGHPGTSTEAHQKLTSSPPSSPQAKTHADTPSQLNVGGDTTVIHESPTLDPLLAGLVSAFIITAVIITLLLFLKLRRRDNRPEFRRLQDLPMDDMMEDTPLSMYSY
ncbi:uncharacterized protein LOC127349800 isoform X2 [Dicentrarchus labrax]|uniref:Uncharacterized protein n=1 Tax=Dicentrarchus labrax TaxID=13489 RepID=A0A8P4GQD7_DICLA|nr:uncharacterized protein LOC127349800 isoform X2 [Dicentrarchus labrax]